MGVPPAAEGGESAGNAPAGAGATGSPAPAGEKPGAADPPAAKALRIYSTYEKLSPEEGARVDSGPTFTAAVEGRVADGSFWRLSARAQPNDELCLQLKQWDPSTRSGGTAGGGCEDRDGWGFLGGGSSKDLVALTGWAPVNAATLRIVAKDGAVATVPGVFRQAMEVTFYGVYLGCDGPDIARLEALDAAGRVISTYDTIFRVVGYPSQSCEARSS